MIKDEEGVATMLEESVDEIIEVVISLLTDCDVVIELSLNTEVDKVDVEIATLLVVDAQPNKKMKLRKINFIFIPLGTLGSSLRWQA